MAPHWQNSCSLISKNHVSFESVSCPMAFVCRSARVQRWGARRAKSPLFQTPTVFGEGGWVWGGRRRELGLWRCLSMYLSTSRSRRASHKVARCNSFVQIPFYSSFRGCRRVRQDPTCSFVSHQQRRIAWNACKKKKGGGVLCCAFRNRVCVSSQNISIEWFPLLS